MYWLTTCTLPWKYENCLTIQRATGNIQCATGNIQLHAPLKLLVVSLQTYILWYGQISKESLVVHVYTACTLGRWWHMQYVHLQVNCQRDYSRKIMKPRMTCLYKACLVHVFHRYTALKLDYWKFVVHNTNVNVPSHHEEQQTYGHLN